MNTPLDRSHGAKLCLIVVTSLLVSPGLGGAAELKEARVTQVVKDVKLLPQTAAPRPAAVNDAVRNDTAVRTGVESRTELTFTDQTLARLGANTIFSFAEGTRNLELKDGAMLLRVPKNSGGAKINTAAITAAITGTTVMIETHPVTTKTKGGFYKFIVLEGTARLFLPGHLGESVLVHAGQMIIMRPDGKKIPNPVDVDISKIMQSSLLITGFAPLPSAPLIALQEQQQNTLKSSGQLFDTNLVIFGGGTGVSVTDPTNTNAVSVATTAQSSSSSSPPPPPPPPPPASKFGALTTITSPDPFVINSGTTIQTDPTITANGQTYSGKIWRGPSVDGALSVYAFGSTSAFDSASGFDTRVIGNTNGAAFKFNSLQLTGNPTVSTTNGTINLGLFAINGITSGAPGGTLTFAGIHGLLLATQNGPIDLGSEISFSGLHDLIFYARGANSDLTLSSAISGVTHTTLIAQRNVNIDGTTLGTQTLDVIAGQNINLGVNSTVTINASTLSATALDGDLTMILGNSLALNGDARFDSVVPAGTSLASGGNLTLNITGDFSDNSSTAFSQMQATNHGFIAKGGNLSVDISGNVTLNAPVSETEFPGPGDLVVLTNNTGAQIANGGNLTFQAGGNVHVNGFDVQLQNYDESSNPAGHIGTGGNMDVKIGGDLTANSYVEIFLNNRGGGSIGSGGNLTVNIAGALTIGGAASGGLQMDDSNRYDDTGGSTTPSSIGSNASYVVNIGSVTNNGGYFECALSNRDGSRIDGNGTFTWNTPGAFTSQSSTEFAILNDHIQAGSVPNPPGGQTINGDATLTINLGSFTSTGSLSDFASYIDNNGTGTIHGNAANTVNVSGDINAAGPIAVDILDTGFTSAPTTFFGASRIDGNAIVTFGARNINTSSTNNGTPGSFLGVALEAAIYTNAAGTVGGDAIVNVTASQGISAAGDAFFAVANGNFQNLGGGNIAGAGVAVVAPTISTGNLYTQIINYGGSIGQNAGIFLTATNMTVNGSINCMIDNSQSGAIGGDASINYDVSGNAHVTGDAMFQILGSDGAASSAITFNGGTYNVPNGTFEGFMDGNGTMTFTNATISADTIKAGVFGPNGILRIGGGSMSANTLLHLYAPGGNGLIDFVSNVTLNSVGTAAVIAANTVTVENGVVVTIAGSTPANVYANVPNYTGSGGNGSTRGTFGGAGATTQPLGGQPPFVIAAATTRSTNKASASSRSTAGLRVPVLHVSDTSELASLLDHAALGGDGKARIPSGSRNPNASVQPKGRIAAPASNPVRTADARFATVALRAQ